MSILLGSPIRSEPARDGRLPLVGEDSRPAGYRRTRSIPDCMSGNRNSPLINSISGRLFENDEMQGARILRNEACIRYAAMTPVCAGRTGRKDQVRHRGSHFPTAR